MYVKYGDFNFSPGECTIAGVRVIANHSARGFRTTWTAQLHFGGELCGLTPAQITTRLNAIEAALSTNDKDAGLVHDDGSPSTHFLETDRADNLTGNQVLYTKYPEVHGGEYADGRMFSFGVGAELYAPETSLFQYSDTVSQIGNGGADVEWKYNPRIRQWVAAQLAPSTIIQYIHQGFAETTGGWFVPPTPYYTAAPFLDSKSYQIHRRTPDRRRKGYLGRVTSWRYIYNLPAADNTILPVLRMFA